MNQEKRQLLLAGSIAAVRAVASDLRRFCEETFPTEHIRRGIVAARETLSRIPSRGSHTRE